MIACWKQWYYRLSKAREKKNWINDNLFLLILFYDFIVIFGSVRTFVKRKTFQINLLKLFHNFFLSRYNIVNNIEFTLREKKSHKKMQHFIGFNNFVWKKKRLKKIFHILFACFANSHKQFKWKGIGFKIPPPKTTLVYVTAFRFCVENVFDVPSSLLSG